MNNEWFDTEIDRRQSNSLKWDVSPDELPMWVADMDFRAAPAIRDAIFERAMHGVFGYATVTDAWYRAYGEWWGTRHGFPIPPEWLIFCTGVVPAISTTVRKLTTPAEKVVLQTPVYNIFFNSIENNGRRVLDCPLVYDEQAHSYDIDFEALENALSDPQTTLMILCNPHNPVGKIWDRETLAKIGDLCKKHHVTVISDEIHCDLVDPDCAYVPFATASEVCREISITCIAPSKAFNIAGLNTAAVVIPNEALRNRVNRALNTDEVAEPNAFAVEATVAALTQGGEWLDGLRQYIFENKRIASDFLDKELPLISLVPSRATYLLWLDCSALPGDTTAFAAFLREKTGLYLSAGAQYGGHGNRFLRMNVACPKKTLFDGLARLKRGVDLYLS
ncbi:MAG: pyridoxal phosphate-dependent aminotransferase [Oscillospiraceae bacterium]|nr:pyridoxal phosphate-dependent aminotransferase [Oscillospiraceae bacterium]